MSSLETTPSYKRYSSRSMSRSRSSCSRSPPKVEDVVVAATDYTATADDEVSLKSGDIVEVLDSKSALGSKYRGRVYCYENHFFQTRGPSLDYVFSVPTYKMYYY
ncbi:uncharacterized protein LOC119192635 [Manduca sexta]|uniref:uncharacterized protein LOC119192635 n=1 Tax=Manduca sexta TaxID=7130 RepID=UPI00188DF8C2|nr:uncharacterized protein LOC119192635 [Manduca sexta]